MVCLTCCIAKHIELFYAQNQSKKHQKKAILGSKSGLFSPQNPHLGIKKAQKTMFFGLFCSVLYRF